MAALVNTVYPSYADPTNYSGANSATRSGGLVVNPEQHEAVLGLERSGRLGLTIFGLVQLPREVLMLQDERSAKTKAPNVSSSTQTTSDEDRLLSKVEDGTTPHVTPKKDGGGNGGPGGYSPPPANDGETPPAATPASAAVKAAQTTETHAASFLAQNGAAPAPAPRREPVRASPAPNLLGKGNAVYLGVISSSSHIAGRNISLLT